MPYIDFAPSSYELIGAIAKILTSGRSSVFVLCQVVDSAAFFMFLMTQTPWQSFAEKTCGIPRFAGIGSDCWLRLESIRSDRPTVTYDGWGSLNASLMVQCIVVSHIIVRKNSATLSATIS